MSSGCAPTARTERTPPGADGNCSDSIRYSPEQARGCRLGAFTYGRLMPFDGLLGIGLLLKIDRLLEIDGLLEANGQLSFNAGPLRVPDHPRAVPGVVHVLQLRPLLHGVRR